MSPDFFREMISDLLKVAVSKVKVPKQMPAGGWTVVDILVNDKPLSPEQSQAMTDILFWHQWWEVGYITKCQCGHRLGVHSKTTDTHATCLSGNCNCVREIDTGVYITEGDTTVIQALSRMRGPRG